MPTDDEKKEEKKSTLQIKSKQHASVYIQLLCDFSSVSGYKCNSTKVIVQNYRLANRKWSWTVLFYPVCVFFHFAAL